MGLLDTMRRPRVGRSRSTGKIDLFPSAPLSSPSGSVAKDSSAIAFPSIPSNGELQQPSKLRKRRRSLKEFFAFPHARQLAANAEQDAVAAVPPVPALPELVYSPSGSSTATTKSIDSPVSYASSLNRRRTGKEAWQYGSNAEQPTSKTLAEGQHSKRSLEEWTAVQIASVEAAVRPDTRNQAGIMDIPATAIEEAASIEGEEQDNRPLASAKSPTAHLAPSPLPLVSTSQPELRLSLSVDTALTAANDQLAPSPLDSTPRFPRSLALPLLSPSPVSPTFSTSSSSAASVSSFGNSGPLRSQQSSASPRSLSFGARLCLDLTLSKLRLESPNSGNPALLLERLNSPMGRVYPSSTLQAGRLGREGRGTLGMALGRTKLLRRLEGRRLTLLEEVELDVLRKAPPARTGSPTSAPPAPSRSPSSAIPSHRAVANLAHRALAAVLGDDKAAVAPALAVHQPSRAGTPVPSGISRTGGFQQLQEAAWKKWVERPPYTVRCVPYTVADGGLAAQELSHDSRRAAKELRISQRARCLAGLAEPSSTPFSRMLRQDVMTMPETASTRHPAWQSTQASNQTFTSLAPPTDRIESPDVQGAQAVYANARTPQADLQHLPPGGRASSGDEAKAPSPCSTTANLPSVVSEPSATPGEERDMNLKRSKSSTAAAAAKHGGKSTTTAQEGKKLEKKRSGIFSRPFFGRSSSSRKSAPPTSSSAPSPDFEARSAAHHVRPARTPHAPLVSADPAAEARPPREAPPASLSDRRSLLSPSTSSSVSLSSTSSAALPLPQPRRRVSSAVSDSANRRHTVFLASPTEPLPSPSSGSGSAQQRPISQIVQLPASSSEPNLALQPAGTRMSFVEAQRPRHDRGASSPESSRRKSALRPASKVEVEEDEDLPLAVLQQMQKRLSTAAPSPAKPARVVSFHENAQAPPSARRQSSLPAPAPRNRASYHATADRRSTFSAHAHAQRPVSLALSDFAAEELYRLQREVQVLRQQQREMEALRAQDGQAEQDLARKKQEERKRWEDHRRRSGHIDDLAAKARPGLPQSFSAPQLQAYSHPQLLAPQPIYPSAQVQAPFVHPAFAAAFAGSGLPMYWQQQQGVQMNMVQQPYALTLTPPATPPPAPVERRDSPNRFKAAFEDPRRGSPASEKRQSAYFTEGRSSPSRSQPAAGSDAFLAHAQARSSPHLRPATVYETTAWTAAEPTRSSGPDPGKSRRGSMMLDGQWDSAVPRAADSGGKILAGQGQNRQSQLWA